MSMTLKPLGLQNPLGKRSPLGVSSDWIQTFPVLQLSLEYYDRLSQSASTYDEFGFSPTEQPISEKPQQSPMSMEIESQPVQAKEASNKLAVTDAEPITAPTAITETLSSQLNRLPLAPLDPLGNRLALNIVSRRSTISSPNIADVEALDRLSFLESIETSTKTTPSESVDRSTPDSPLQSEATNLAGEPPRALPIQRLTQPGIEPDLLRPSFSEVESRKLPAIENDSPAIDREPNFTSTPIEAITETDTQPISKAVEPKSVIDTKPEEIVSQKVNFLNDVDGDRASISDQLVSPKLSNNTIPSPAESPQTNDDEQGISNDVSNRSAEINLKPDSPTQADAPPPQPTTEDLGTTPNQENNTYSDQLTSPFESLAPSGSFQERSETTSEPITEAIIQPLLEQSGSSEEATQVISLAIENTSSIKATEPSSFEEVAQIVSPEIETTSETEPAKLTTDPKISRSTIPEPTIDRTETIQTNTDALTTESPNSTLNLAQIETPVNLSFSNINSEESAIASTEPIRTNLENSSTDNRNVVTKQNNSEVTQAQITEPIFQKLSPLGMIQPLASDRTITPASISPIYPQGVEPSQASLSQVQQESQPSVSEISSETIAQSPTDQTQDLTREVSKVDNPSDLELSISDSVSQNPLQRSEESAVSNARSWQDVAASLTDISEASTIQRELQELTEFGSSSDDVEAIASPEMMIHPRSLEEGQPGSIETTSPQPTSPEKSSADDEQLEQLAWTVYHQLRQRFALDGERHGQLTHHPPWIEIIIPTSLKTAQSATNAQPASNTIEMLSPIDAKLLQLTGEVYYRVRSRLEVDRERYGGIITKV